MDEITKGIKALSRIIALLAALLGLLKTILDAFELGYQIIVPTDASASPSQQGHQATIESLKILKIPILTTVELIKNDLI